MAGTITIRSLSAPGQGDVAPPGAPQSGAPDPWAGFTGAYDPTGQNTPAPQQSQSPTQMQMLPGLGQQQPQTSGDPWSGYVGSFDPAPPPPPARMSQGEAVGHSLARGATAGWSDELRGAATLGGMYANRYGSEFTGPGFDDGSTLAQQNDAALQNPRKVYEEQRDIERDAQKRAEVQWPWTSTGADLGGALLTPLPMGKARAASEAVSAGAHAALPAIEHAVSAVSPWVQRMGQAARRGAAYGGIAGAGEGEGLTDTGQKALAGTAVGGVAGLVASPVIDATGALVRKGVDRVQSMARGLKADFGAKADDVAARAVANSLETDAAQRGANWTPDVIAGASKGEVPIVRGDLGGERTLAMARSAADQSTKGREALQNVTQDRFFGQTPRAKRFIAALKGGADSEEMQRALDQEVRKANQAAYGGLYARHGAPMVSPTLDAMAESPSVQWAMKQAIHSGKDRAIADGQRAFNGALHNMQFWDYTYRNLQDLSSKLFQADRQPERASAVFDIAKKLRNELDNLTSGRYRGVREGAAAGFKAKGVDADNMLDVGKQLVSARGENGIYGKLLESATPAERELAAHGFMNELIDRVGEVRDNQNILNQAFLGAKGGGSDAARQRIYMVLGSQRAKQLEVYLRAESLVHRLHEAVTGNSKTHRFFAEAALGVGGEALLGVHGAHDSEGGWGIPDTAHLVGMALLGGLGLYAHHRGAQFDEQVAQRIGEMLASNDPATLRRGIDVVSHSKGLMDGLRAAGDHVGEFIGKLPAQPRDLPGRAAVTAATPYLQNLPNPFGNQQRPH